MAWLTIQPCSEVQQLLRYAECVGPGPCTGVWFVSPGSYSTLWLAYNPQNRCSLRRMLPTGDSTTWLAMVCAAQRQTHVAACACSAHELRLQAQSADMVPYGLVAWLVPAHLLCAAASLIRQAEAKCSALHAVPAGKPAGRDNNTWQWVRLLQAGWLVGGWLAKST